MEHNDSKDELNVKPSILSNDDLKTILTEIKAIVKNDNEEEQLIAIDQLFSRILEQIEFANDIDFEDSDEEIEGLEIDKGIYQDLDEEYIEEIDELMDNMKQLKKDLDNYEISKYDISYIRDELRVFGRYWDKNFSEKLESLKNKFNLFIDRIEKEYYLSIPEETMSRNIHSISSVKSILDEILDAEDFITNNSIMNSEIQNMIDKSKERLAWFRAKKKLDSAEIAMGGNNLKKLKIYKVKPK